MLTSEELGQRVGRFRKAKHLDQSELGQMIGLSQSQISRVESGDRKIPATWLTDIAEALGVEIADLIEERPLADTFAMAARADGGAASARATDFAKHVIRLHRLLAKSGFSAGNSVEPWAVPNAPTPYDEGHELASRAREKLRLGADPVSSILSQAADPMGLSVVTSDFQFGVDGLWTTDGDLSLAVVNSDPNGHRQRFTIAHELCHHLLADEQHAVHVDLNVFDTRSDPQEVRANSFAASFLLPDEAVRTLSTDGPATEIDAVRLAYEYGVSIKTVGWRMKNAGVRGERGLVERLTDDRTAVFSAAVAAGCNEQYSQCEARRGTSVCSPRLREAAIGAYSTGIIGGRVLGRLFGLNSRDVIEQFGE